MDAEFINLTAKEPPCLFNNCAIFYKGKFETVNPVDASYVKRLLKRQRGSRRSHFF